MICFDNDTAGKQGGMELGDKLKKLGVNTFIASWDNNYNDLNDLLKANALADIKLNKVA